MRPPVKQFEPRRVSLHFVRAGLVIFACAATLLWSRSNPSAQGGDTTPPTVIAQSPGAGAANVSTSIIVSATFSEPIQPSTLVMEVRNASNVLQPSNISYEGATRTATLTLISALASNQTFTVTVSGARDVANNPMTQVTWSFTTATPGFQDVTLPQTGLTAPVTVQFASDGRIFVGEKSGRIHIYDNLTDSTPTLFADLRTNVHNFWDRGLLGMVLHPSFPSVPYVYVLYTFDAVLPTFPAPRWGAAGVTADPCADPTGNGCVVTGRLSRLNINDFIATPLTTANEQVLVTDWFQQFPSHSIGNLGFGVDGALYATGGDGASFNYVDYGPPSSPAPNPSSGDPNNEGGSLRSQDARTTSDPMGLAGTLIRVNPDTGAAPQDNPLFSSGDVNTRRVVAYGLRNPFRFTIRPGTNEVWIGDVGWNEWEEINRVQDPLVALVRNFGWPCYEGNGAQPGYDAANRTICENLYAQAPALSGLTAPYYTYRHADRVVANEACPTGSSSISGLAFYPESGGSYPSSYNGALFFSDYSRDCIWAMRVGAGGLPDPSNIVTIKTNPGTPNEGPVYLTSGPEGDIYYVGLGDSRIHRIRYSTGNQPPTAQAQAAPTSGSSPLTVTFSAVGSSDPEGQTLTYAWDLDGDGAFDDAATVAPQFIYSSATPKAVTVRVRVTDSQGLADVASVVVSINNTAPTAAIAAPTGALLWKVGDSIAFSGSATDAEEGALPASKLTWSVIMHHCPSNCHSHSITDYVGVSSGSFAAPDHEYPSHLELQLTATDSGGLQSTTSVMLNPRTVDLTLQTNPAGLTLSLNAVSGTTPLTRTVIAGSTNTLGAPSPQSLGTFPYNFSAWSDGGPQSHSVVAPVGGTTYTASYTVSAVPTGLVAGYGMNEGGGGTVADLSGHGLAGTISGAAWTTGKFGGALLFDGVNDWVTVADANDLDFTTAMTLEAWVYPTASGSGSWRNVLIKERPNGEVFNLYANADTNAPVIYAVPAAPPTPLDARGSTALPLNTWTHLAVTYDNAMLRLFVNGAQVGTHAFAGPLLTSTGDLRLGGNSVWGEFFQGRIDEVRIYNRALTAAEITTDMNTPIGGTAPDTTAPARSNPQPTGTLAAGTTQTTLSLTTDETATCRYSTTAGVSYSSMTNTFTTTGGTAHSTTASGLVNGGSYTYYVRCQDIVGNANTSDLSITFAVAVADTTPPTRSNGLPSGPLPAGTTQAALSLTTNEPATCRYGPTAGTQYASLPSVFATTGGTSHSTSVTGLANGGSYAYYIRCQDTAGNPNTNDFSISFTVATPDTTAPAVSLTAPANGASVSGLVTVNANASDNVGVVGVQFLLNGSAIGAEDTASPYSISWNSASVVNGNYQLSARARDAAGNSTTSAPVNVVVSNTDTGLIAAYNFNEGTGAALTDRAGLGHTGTISGAAWTVDGKSGGALSFDGINDWVTVNDAADLDFTTAMTLEAWVYPTANGSGSWRNVLIKERAGGEVYNLYSNADTNAPVIYVVRSAQPGVPLDARATSTLPLNTWTHVAATFDNTTLRVFVNGTQVGSAAVAGPLLTSTGALRIGGNSIWGEYFQGRIDEIRIYNRALTAVEIQSDMNAPIQ